MDKLFEHVGTFPMPWAKRASSKKVPRWNSQRLLNQCDVWPPVDPLKCNPSVQWNMETILRLPSSSTQTMILNDSNSNNDPQTRKEPGCNSTRVPTSYPSAVISVATRTSGVWTGRFSSWTNGFRQGYPVWGPGTTEADAQHGYRTCETIVALPP